jgi:predicted TIM-barrel fold metal-dependent hydrolase
LIIDFHTHLIPPSFDERREEIAAKDRTFAALFADPKSKIANHDELLAAMDEDGVDMSVALGFGWTDAGVARESNDYLLKAAGVSNGRIIAFCSIDPSWGDDALSEVKRCVAAGARGIGELHPSTQGLTLATDRGLACIMEFAAQEELPVVVHGSEPVGHDYPGKGYTYPSDILAMATRFPNVKIVAAHWGGGLPFYAHMPEVRKALANVYFDSAATPFLYDQSVFSTVASAIGPGRMLFGSDFPLLNAKRVAEMAIANLNPAYAGMFLGENARGLLNE